MRFQKLWVAMVCAALLLAAHRAYGWAGVAGACGALVMWLLLHFTRMMQVLKRAAERPVGFVDSAVMFNASLRPGVTLLHVLALTRSLGELRSSKASQIEHYRWTDGSGSWVECVLHAGKLRQWTLQRLAATPHEAPPSARADSSAAAP